MNPRLRKSVRDLLANPGRTALVVLALVIGLWGVGSLVVSYAILTNDLRENYWRTKPPHVKMISKQFDRLDLAAFRQRPEIESAEFRDFSRHRIEVFPDHWVPLFLFGVEDFNQFQLARFYQEEGKKAPDPGTMLIERDGLNISNLKVGSAARVRVGGRILRVPVSGVCFDPAQAPATMDHLIYAYVDKGTYSAITGEPANQQLAFRLRKASTKQDVQRLIKPLLEDLSAQGITVDRVKIPKPDEHPHQWQLNTLIALQGAIGLLAFLLSAVLVSQLMASLLAQQVRQIGVLKAIGASRRQVLEIYVMMVFLLGAISSAIAVPLAVKSGYGFAAFVSGVLNFEILTTSLPLNLYLLLVLAGLSLPLLSALPSVLRGTRVSVYDALSDYGIGQNVAGVRARRRAKHSVPHGLRLALRNAIRRKRRLAVTVAAMALGVGIFGTGFNVRQALLVFLSATDTATKHDVEVVLENSVPLEKATAPFRAVPGVRRIEAWNGGRGLLQLQSMSTAEGISVVALPYDTDLLVPEVVKGRWLRAEEPEVVMNARAMEAFGYPTIGTYQWLDIKDARMKARVVGVVKELSGAKVYIDRAKYDSLVNPDHLVSSLMFVSEERRIDQVMALKANVEKAIATSDLRVLEVNSQAELVKVIYDHLNIILTTFAVLAMIVLVVGALGMASATGINIMERTREIGILRAIGATPRTIYHLFVTEGMVISTASILLGLVLAWPLSALASAFFGDLILGEGMSLRFAFSHLGLVITVCVTLAFGWLASRIPAREAVKVSTREALSYE